MKNRTPKAWCPLSIIEPIGSPAGSPLKLLRPCTVAIITFWIYCTYGTVLRYILFEYAVQYNAVKLGPPNTCTLHTPPEKVRIFHILNVRISIHGDVDANLCMAQDCLIQLSVSIMAQSLSSHEATSPLGSSRFTPGWERCSVWEPELWQSLDPLLFSFPLLEKNK